jgi:hypothetical protein
MKQSGFLFLSMVVIRNCFAKGAESSRAAFGENKKEMRMIFLLKPTEDMPINHGTLKSICVINSMNFLTPSRFLPNFIDKTN